MKFKEIFIVFITCLLVIILYLISGKNINIENSYSSLYNVYLSGNLIGTIEDKDSLYQLIDTKQQEIKNKYNVSNVYPPSTLEIIENYSYDSPTLTTSEVYSKIEKDSDFTIRGYEIKIGATEEHEEYNLYVLDKNIFYEAIKKFILAFVPEEDYEKYINDDIEELSDVGTIYDELKFLEDITIREKYVSVNEKIYETSEELAKTFIFGIDYNEKTYVVEKGDTVESISDEFEINTQEFLIANTKYASENSLLVIGDTVNIAYVTPILSFQYKVYEMKEVEYAYQNTTKIDSTKPSDYSEITTPGVDGLSLITSHYTVLNGELNSDTEIDNQVIIRETVDQVTTKGRKATFSSGSWVYSADVDGDWLWPTKTPYLITSYFGYRKLGGREKAHKGIDISGSLFGTDIKAANDGVITATNSGCANYGYYGNQCGGEFGNYVVINHGSVYTIYAHLTNNVRVKVGQTVSKGTTIGYMGDSGSSTGTHLHFGLSIGDPLHGGTFKNPLTLYGR